MPSQSNKGGARSGAGRKPGSPNKEKKENARIAVVRVRLSETEHDQALFCAGQVGESMSEFVRAAIQLRCHPMEIVGVKTLAILEAVEWGG